jgi:hypothetical protein
MAQCQSGFKYYCGKGVPEDFAKAFKWFEKSALQGNALAQYQLARMYSHGLVVPKNDAKAYAWASICRAMNDASLKVFNTTFADDLPKFMKIPEGQIPQAQALAAELFEQIKANMAE